MTDPIRAASVLRELDSAGVRLSIDDFGTGQISLRYLSTLPIHELKIDRTFITDMLEHPSHAAIVHSIIELGHNLGFVVVGEGVETPEILADLASTGCDYRPGLPVHPTDTGRSTSTVAQSIQTDPLGVTPYDVIVKTLARRTDS